jgi:hypothetical protein
MFVLKVTRLLKQRCPQNRPLIFLHLASKRADAKKQSGILQPAAYLSNRHGKKKAIPEVVVLL